MSIRAIDTRLGKRNSPAVTPKRFSLSVYRQRCSIHVLTLRKRFSRTGNLTRLTPRSQSHQQTPPRLLFRGDTKAGTVRACLSMTRSASWPRSCSAAMSPRAPLCPLAFPHPGVDTLMASGMGVSRDRSRLCGCSCHTWSLPCCHPIWLSLSPSPIMRWRKNSGESWTLKTEDRLVG